MRSKKILKGTLIKEINDQPVSSRADIENYAEKTNKVEAVYYGKNVEYTLTRQQLGNLLGILQFEAEGVGTLTYIDPSTMEFGAIGHEIPLDVIEQSSPNVNGVLYHAISSKVYKSVPGKPGFKVAEINESEPLGTVYNNRTYGVFGKWEGSSIGSLPAPIEVMQENKIQLGKASILSAIHDNEVEQFSIEITKIEPTQFQFTIVDSNLIKQTGGIVQGMSGSPIIQNGEFIGAITHMYVERPEDGIGLKILEMLEKR